MDGGRPLKGQDSQTPKRLHPVRRHAGIAQQLNSLFHQLPGFAFGVLARVSLVQDGDDPPHVVRLQDPLHVDSAQLAFGGYACVFQSLDDRQTFFLIEHVAYSHAVAPVAPQVCDILSNLPGHAQLATRFSEAATDLVTNPGGQRP